MASIIPGYQYDIFISYRQKDNKHDGWVTEFVNNLKGELESTFKEEISIYFDINPHDGLLETHDVDESLKEKLKCLVFIPIISRTYCDPKSFAWEHEFKAFVELASKDQFGLKVKLPNGNVASRVLPVRIHDLDPADIKLCETELGGVLRGLDFVFSSPGVNRPLKSSDDPDKNLNKTYYPDQVNKVGNAVKGIIYCLRFGSDKQELEYKPSPLNQKNINGYPSDSSTGFPKKEIFHKLVTRMSSLSRWWIILFFISFFLVGVIAASGWIRFGSAKSALLPIHSAIFVENILMDLYGQYPVFDISPNGRIVAFGSNKGIQIRSLSDFSIKILNGTENTTQLVFSPDGESIAFSKGGKIYKIGINGHPISVVYQKGYLGPGMNWGNDGYIYFSPALGSEGIWRVSPNGGDPEQITFVVDSLGENAHAWPQLLPNSKALLFTSLGPSGGSFDSRIVVQNLSTGKRKIVINEAIFGRYLCNKSILFAKNEGNIYILPFDLKKLITRHEPKAVLSNVNTGTWGGAAFIAASETGNLIFYPRVTIPLKVVSVVDRSGKSIDGDSIPLATLNRMGHGWDDRISISPSGHLLAFTGRSFGINDIFILNLYTGDTERITFDPSEDEYPVWSPDGKKIAYTSSMTGTTRRLFIKNLGSAESPNLIKIWPRHIHFTSWSPDGKWLAACDFTTTYGSNCYLISVESDETISLATSQFNESDAQFSPNGKWLAFQSNESGRSEIYVVSFPKLDGIRQISNDGGSRPRWDKGGKFIYYLSNGSMVAQPIELDNDFKKGNPSKLFITDALNFEPSPDGQKFYLVMENKIMSNPPLLLITNWFKELKINARE